MKRINSYLPLKRGVDVLLASVLLVLALPLMALIAVVVALDSGTPVLFRQTRIGRFGRPFTILKFRTLHPTPHALTEPLPAATRSGVFLRRWGLDELPQLWNVIRGDMSLVGPRPTVPSQVERYTAFERRRLALRPGLTGWAQVQGRNTLRWESRIRLDVDYVERTSLGLDAWILLRTPFALLSAEDAYGPGGRNSDFAPMANPDVRAA
ncbi:MAG: sugar transferase [Rhodothermales bacterium]|nr:sugar transferase [Rhodothermales bacterium]